MDTKRLKQSKHSKKMKASANDDTAEVFVLPPDLLKKLGIRLGHVSNNTDTVPEPIAPVVENENKLTKNDSELNKKAGDESILETASLMKQSVFLSPTFVSTITNAIPNVMEIVNVDKQSSVTNSELGEDGGNRFQEGNIGITNMFIQESIAAAVDEVDSALKSIGCGSSVYSKLTYANNENMIVSLDEMANIDNIHSGEYNKSNSKIDDLTLFTLQIPKAQTDLSKIKIISEEIQRSSHLKDLKYVNTPVTIHTKIGMKLDHVGDQSLDRDNDNSMLLNGSNPHTNDDTSIDRKVSKMLTSNKIILSNSYHQNENDSNLTENYENYIKLTPEITSNVLVNLNIDQSEMSSKNLIEEEIINKRSSNIVNSQSNLNNEENQRSEIQKNKHGASLSKDFENIIGSDRLNPKKLEINKEHSMETYDNKFIDYCVKENKMNMDHKDNVSIKGNIISNIFCHNNLNNENNSIIVNDGGILSEHITLETEYRDLFELSHSEITNNESCSNYDGRKTNFEICKDVDNNLNTENTKCHEISTSMKITPKELSVNEQAIGCCDLNISIQSLNQLNPKITNLQDNQVNNILKIDGESTVSSTNTKLTKVEEIATYLKKISHIYSDKKNTRRSNNNKKECIKVHSKTIKSKLCKQGVEKPGGINTRQNNNDEVKALKTYQRQNKFKKNYSPTVIQCKTVEFKKKDEYSDQINTLADFTNIKTQEFCLCNDFGRLDYYDCGDPYEHIHFSQHLSTNCDSYLIFNIYNDHEYVMGNEELNNDCLPIDNAQTVDFNICWYDAQYAHNQNHEYCSRTECTNKGELSPMHEKEVHTVELVHSDSVLHLDNLQSSLMATSNENVNYSNLIDSKEHISTNNYSKKYKKDSAANSDHKESLKLYKLDHINPDENIIVFEENNIGNKQMTNLENASSAADEIPQVEIVIDYGKSGINTDKNDISMDLGDDQNINDNHSSESVAELVTFDMEMKIKEEDTSNDDKSKLINCSFPAGKGNVIPGFKKKKKIPKHKDNEGVLVKPPKNKEKLERKRSNSVVSSSGSIMMTDNNEPDPKKTIKCGVCNELLPERKWESHVIGQHEFIAWKSGDTFDLDDLKLQKNLHQMLKIAGVLKCTFCNLEIRKLKKFIEHVRICMTVKDSDESEVLQETQPFIEPLNVTCALCKTEVQSSEWFEHIGKYHNYLAWIDGMDPLNIDDEDAVRDHLLNIIRENGAIFCQRCGIARKRPKLYLSHVKSCDALCIKLQTPPPDVNDYVICGVCAKKVSGLCWTEHIAKAHNYLAWKEGSSPLDLEDAEAVRLHLYNIVKTTGELICNKCGISRKYAKSYLEHIKDCVNISLSKSKDCLEELNVTFGLSNIKTDTVVCGVCKTEVKKDDWYEHIRIEHQYLAWINGQTPLDVTNEEAVYKFLNAISKEMGGFMCDNCGLVRKYYKTYSEHVQACKRYMDSTTILNAMNTNELVECAVCHEKVEPTNWRKHAVDNHYNIAWVVGDPSIDLNNPYAVEGFIKDYQLKHNLRCKICGITRVSRVGFYAHILLCGKTDEETEMFKETCEYCNKKFLRIYKSQHMTAHRETENAKERKSILEEENKQFEDLLREPVNGQRKAAVKAKNVIEKYRENREKEGCHHCDLCGFSTDVETELFEHVCVDLKYDEATDSDESINLDQYSDVESVDTDIDSNLSEEELEFHDNVKKKRPSDERHTSPSATTNKVSRIPFSISHPRSYLKQSGRDYIDVHWTSESLFTHWRTCEYEAVSESDHVKYLPPVAESCKIKFSETVKEWSTYSRFEARIEETCSGIFVGGSVQCISWAPEHVDWSAKGNTSHFLAVACHLSADVPRYAWADTVAGPGLLQIWDYSDMTHTAPQLVLCIAHDYGTVWAIDWCPSGARDVLDQESGTICRLGLLAAACSNGSAYIFCVPYPSTITKKENLFYKLKPVAELRLAMAADRKVYQATAIRWSPKKQHEHVVVAYSDGTLAYFDLNNESPILQATEDNVTILYPYHDERPLNNSVEGVDLYPRAGVEGVGAVCCGSAVGGAARRGAAVPGLVHTHVPIARARFLPHWPSAVLTGDDFILNTSVNELEWWGGGRRLGGVRACAACVRCGRAALAATGLLRVTHAHPAYPDLKKTIVGVLEMTPLYGGKRKQKNDDLSMIVEPITYEDAVKKYGLQYQTVTSRDRAAQQKASGPQREPYPERFPLSDMTSLAFCPSAEHHDRLAVAVSAGFVLLMTL